MATDPTAMFGALLDTLKQSGQIPQQAQAYQGNQQALASGQQQLAMGALQLSAAQQQQAQAQQYQQDVQSYYQNPTLDRLSALAAKYPQQAAALKQSYDIMNEGQRQSTLTQYGSLYNAADNGKVDIVKSQLQQIKNAEQAQGIDTTDIDQAISGLGTDPDSTLRYIKGFAQTHLAAAGAKGFEVDPSRYSMGADGSVLDHETGQIVHAGTQQPKYMTIKNADGSESIVAVGGGDPASDGTPAPSSGAAGGYSGNAPRSVRNNNPGNLKASPFTRSLPGFQSVDPDGFAVFASPQAGANAQAALLTNYIGRGYNTVAKIIGRWAPPSDGNNTAAYVQTVAKQLGVNPNDAISPAMVPQLQSAISRVEGGPNNPSNGPAPTSAGSVASPSGVKVLYTSKAPTADGTPGDVTKQGADYLASLPSNIGNLAQGIVNGQIAMPSSFAQSKPFWQSVMAAAYHLDPTMDSSTQPLRVAAAKQFTGNGKAAQVVSSVNRLAYHMNDLYRDSQALTGVNLGPLSGIVNAGAQSFEKAALARYNAALPFIAGELQKLSKNGSATEGESKQIMANLAPSQPASARIAAMQQLVELAQGQFKPIRDQWQSAFGSKPMPVDITPETDTIFDHVAQDKGPVAIDPASGTIRGATPGPVHVQTPAQAAALRPGTLYVAPDGQVRRR